MDESKIEITVEAHCDDTPVRGNAQASGDAALDREAEDAILERLEGGDVWAWACVRVVATCQGFRGESSWLGACNYASEADFRQSGGYFDDLRAEAVSELEDAIADARRRADRATEAAEPPIVLLDDDGEPVAWYDTAEGGIAAATELVVTGVCREIRVCYELPSAILALDALDSEVPPVVLARVTRRHNGQARIRVTQPRIRVTQPD